METRSVIVLYEKWVLSGIISLNYQVKDQISLLKWIWTLLITLKGTVLWSWLFLTKHYFLMNYFYCNKLLKDENAKKGHRNCARHGVGLRFELLYIFLEGVKMPVSLSATSSFHDVPGSMENAFLLVSFPLWWPARGMEKIGVARPLNCCSTLWPKSGWATRKLLWE